jgi:hypothetical protein
MHILKKLLYAVGLTLLTILTAIIVAACVFGTRSGVSNAQVAEPMPGDSVFPTPWITIDRAAVLPANAAGAWKWIVQLGEGRAGWYAPLWLENAVHAHSADSILVQYQDLAVGENVPDFGGGGLRVLAVVPEQYIEYGSIPSATSTSDDYRFTWTLALEDETATSTTFHLRLRIPRPLDNTIMPPAILGLFDYLADEAMFAGLKEKLSQ